LIDSEFLSHRITFCSARLENHHQYLGLGPR